PGDRQTRARPAPGTAGDRQRGRARQHLLLPFRRRPGTPAARGGEAGMSRRDERGDPLRDPALYSSRELGQLAFQVRVLALAQDPSVPLLERLRFLCISCTNLDEFFEIRAA